MAALLVSAVFLLAGFIKGVAGFGLPTVTLGILALSRPLPEAMALMLVPALVTNIWQALAGPALWTALRRVARLPGRGRDRRAGRRGNPGAIRCGGAVGGVGAAAGRLLRTGAVGLADAASGARAGTLGLAADRRILRPADRHDRQFPDAGGALFRRAQAAAAGIRPGLRPRRGGGDPGAGGGHGRARICCRRNWGWPRWPGWCRPSSA